MGANLIRRRQHGYAHAPVEVPTQPVAPIGDLATMGVRVTLMSFGSPTPHTAVMPFKLGDNEFRFTNIYNGHPVIITGYRMETGYGKIAGEDFAQACNITNIGDTITVILKGT